MFKSDLSSVLPPQDRPSYPNETYQVRRPAGWRNGAQTGQMEGADIVIVGNSLMQPLYGFPDALSNKLDRPVSLMWRIHPLGPYVTLLDYLDSADFKKSRPKVIVWSFHEMDMGILIDDKTVWKAPVVSKSAFLETLKTSLAR